MNADEIKVTPRDTVEALRLMRREKWLTDPADDADTKEAIQGVVALYLAGTRSGEIDQEFRDWYETADMGALMDDGADPTG